MSLIVIEAFDPEAVSGFLLEIIKSVHSRCSVEIRCLRDKHFIIDTGGCRFNIPNFAIIQSDSPSKNAADRLVLYVEDVEVTLRAAQSCGGRIIESESYVNTYSIEGPEDFRISVSNSNTSISDTLEDILQGYSDSLAMEKSSTEENSVAVVHETKSVHQDYHWNPHYGKIIPSIHPYLLHEGSYRLITPNCHQPIYFCNDVFEGHFVFLLNSFETKMEDAFKKRFENDNNRFEVQVQGKFKRVPKGQFYLGAEITKPMKLGIFTKGMCQSILQFCRTFNSSLHHSFGDDKNYELPHMTTPFWSSIDRLIVSAADSVPPPLYVPFPEPLQSRRMRKDNPSFNMDISLDCVYSFSFKTSYIDIERWQVIGIPLLKTMDFHTFWANADLRFIAYFIDPVQSKLSTSAPGLPIYHPQSALQQVFGLEIQHHSNHPEWNKDPYKAYQQASMSAETNNKSTSMNTSAPSSAFTAMQAFQNQKDEDDEEEEENAIDEEEQADNDVRMTIDDSDDETAEDHNNLFEEGRISEIVMTEYFDASNGYKEDPIFVAVMEDIQRYKQSMESLKQAIKSQSQSVSKNENSKAKSMKSKKMQKKRNTQGSAVVPPHNAENDENSGDKSTKYGSLDRCSLSSVHQLTALSLVVTVVDVEDVRPQRRFNRRLLYAFRAPEMDMTKGELTLSASTPFVLRSYNEWIQLLPVYKVPLECKPSQYSYFHQSEKRRLQLNFTYANIMSAGTTKEKQLLYKLLTSSATIGRASFQNAPIVSPANTAEEYLPYDEYCFLHSSHFLSSASATQPFRAFSRSDSPQRTDSVASTSIVDISSNQRDFRYSETVINVENSNNSNCLTALLSAAAASTPVSSSGGNGTNSPAPSDTIILRQRHNTFWCQEVMVIFDHMLCFLPTISYQKVRTVQDMKKVKPRSNGMVTFIPISSILSIRIVDSSEGVWQVANSITLRISTITKQYLIMMHKDGMLKNTGVLQWMSFLITQHANATISSRTITIGKNARIPKELYFPQILSEVPSWIPSTNSNSSVPGNYQEWISQETALTNVGDKVILNHRNLTLHSCKAFVCSILPKSSLVSSCLEDIMPNWQQDNRSADGLRNASSRSESMGTEQLNGTIWEYERDPLGLSYYLLNIMFTITNYYTAQQAIMMNQDEAAGKGPKKGGILRLFRRRSIENKSRVSLDDFSSKEKEGVDTPSNGLSEVFSEDETEPLPSNHMDYSLLWIEFLNGISIFQSKEFADYLLYHSHYTAQDQCCFWLNMYHILYLHACMIYGVPSTISQFATFFRNACYEFGNELLCLADIEHSIIKFALPRPQVNFIAQSFIPNTEYSFSLHLSDYRLLWAINSGSIQSTPYIPIYQPHLLEQQLTHMMKLNLQQQIKVNPVNRIIVLPSLCQWYSKYLENTPLHPKSPLLEQQSSAKPTMNTSRYMIWLLSDCLSDILRGKIDSLLNQSQNITVKYSAFEYSCRLLKKLPATHFLTVVQEVAADVMDEDAD